MAEFEVTREQKLAQIGNAEKEAERLKSEAEKLRKELGISVTDRNGRELSDAELWDALTPVERYDLYVNHRDRWKELLDSKQEQGIRRLLERKT